MGARTPGSEARVILYWSMAVIYVINGFSSAISQGESRRLWRLVICYDVAIHELEVILEVDHRWVDWSPGASPDWWLYPWVWALLRGWGGHSWPWSLSRRYHRSLAVVVVDSTLWGRVSFTVLNGHSNLWLDFGQNSHWPGRASHLNLWKTKGRASADMSDTQEAIQPSENPFDDFPLTPTRSHPLQEVAIDQPTTALTSCSRREGLSAVLKLLTFAAVPLAS